MKNDPGAMYIIFYYLSIFFYIAARRTLFPNLGRAKAPIRAVRRETALAATIVGAATRLIVGHAFHGGR
jgi:hypothetical protein